MIRGAHASGLGEHDEASDAATLELTALHSQAGESAGVKTRIRCESYILIALQDLFLQ